MAASLTHAEERARDRLRAMGINGREIERIVKDVAYARSMYGALSCAVKLYESQDLIVEEGGRGDVVWAIVRDGRLCTIMLRRSSQPATPEAFRVDCVVTREES